jgi:hypothetical protein
MAKKHENGLGIDVPMDDQTTVESPTVEPAADAPRPRQDQRPICSAHDRQMVAYASNDMFTYYKCPVEYCRETAKRVRPVGPLKNKYGFGSSIY